MPALSWRQTAALPEFGLSGLPAKLDTGARGTALHATAIAVLGDRVTFSLDLPDGPPRTRLRCEASLADLRRVTSSNGAAEERPFIRTRLALGGLEPRMVEVSLTGRRLMRFPLLVGRAALQAWGVLVDPNEPRPEPAQPDHAFPGSCNQVRP